MSPAKRLSRKRFRALCERCRAYGLPGDMPRRDESRVRRFAWHSLRYYRGSEPGLFTYVRALARLAR